jgi:phosphoribosylanthranilate isomerase
MIVQIYEISGVKEARAVAEAGVDHVGVVVGKGLFGNEVGFKKAGRIFASLPKETKGVALSLSYDLDEISEVVEQVGLDILHLCALPREISPHDIIFLKRRFHGLKVMRTIPIIGQESISLARQYEGVVDYLLLDSHKEGDFQVGATGKTHNWEISRGIVRSVKIPVILAGGLGPDNVEEAIKKVRPYGVDSKTKTDKGGGKGKDLTKVREFVKKAKGFQTRDGF